VVGLPKCIIAHTIKGKGVPDHFVVSVNPGTVMMEISGVGESQAMEALISAWT
jgi:ribosomal protein L16/L10AE